MKKGGKLAIFLSLASVSMVFAVMYSIPYVKSVFYDGMLAVTGVSNAELGILMTIYGLGEVFTPGIGGILASKYDHKFIILISSIGTAVACVLIALFPSFAMALVVWTILVFSTLFMVWGTLFKAIRLIVSDEEQGRISGYFGGFIGVCYLVVNGLCLVIYSMVGGDDALLGMKGVFYTLAVLMVLCSIACYFALKKTGVNNPTAVEEMKNDSKETSSFLSEMKAVMKYPSVWYFGGTLFCVYSTNIAIQYFTPYFTGVLQAAAVFSGIVAIVRSYGMRLLGSPTGGFLAGKLKSVSNAIIIAFIATVLSIVAVLLLPPNFTSIGILVALVLLASFFNNIGNGIEYAIPAEGRVPVKYHAAAIGFGSAIGFAPDLFEHVLFGHWIDKFGSAGYTFIFIYGIAAAVAGIALLIKYNADKRRLSTAA